MTWETSTRKLRLPSNWSAIRARILHRDPICRCTGCPKCTPAGCRQRSTEVDHIGADTDHRDANLRGMCTPCHGHRSALQGLAARGHGPTRKRPTRRHPGLRDA